jgi:hypothetical protein
MAHELEVKIVPWPTGRRFLFLGLVHLEGRGWLLVRVEIPEFTNGQT